MKKLTSLSVVIILMIFLGITLSITLAEARTGNTSSSSKSSSSSSSKSRSSSSSSSSFFSNKSKNISSTDSAFSNAAKTNQARTAWQERNKTTVTTPTPSVAIPSNTVPKPNKQTEDQLTAIQKELANTKRQQQLIAIAQAALQIATTNRSPSPVKPVTPTTTTPINSTPVTTAPVTVTTQQPSVPVANPSSANDDKGLSWFTILIMVGGTVWLLMWFKKRATPTTIYRL